MQYKWTVLTVTTVGVLMAGLDSRIMIIGLPQMAASLHADAEQAIWFTQGYVLASTSMLLFMGRISDIFGRVRLFKAGFVLFTLGSVLTSLSQNPTEVILFRAIQGIGTSIMWTNSVAMIIDSTPPKDLGFSLGINQNASSLGATLGLTLSGIILLFFDWRFLFYINVPIGIFGVLWAQKQLREVGMLERSVRVDWLGFASFFIFLLSLLLSLTYAAYGVSAGLAQGLLALSLAGLAAFIYQERKAAHPLLDFQLLRVGPYVGSIIGIVPSVVAWSGVLLLLSLYFQLLRGMSPFDAGIRLLPVDLGVALVSPLTGKLSDRFGKVRFIVAGLAAASASMFLFSTITLTTSYVLVVVFMIIFGIATSIYMSPNASWGMGSIRPERRGVAASLRQTCWNVGQTLSLNLIVWIMSLVVPFEIITGVISAGRGSAVSSLNQATFMGGLQVAFLSLALIQASAIIPVLAGWRVGRRRSTVLSACAKE